MTVFKPTVLSQLPWGAVVAEKEPGKSGGTEVATTVLPFDRHVRIMAAPMDSVDSESVKRFESLSATVLHNADEIIQRWCAKAQKLQPSADSAHFTELRDHLPEFLVSLTTELRSKGETEAHALDASAKRHGAERWKAGWSLDEVVRDYQLLRAAIVQVVGERLPRPPHTDEVLALGRILDNAIAEAVTTFVQYQVRFVAETENRSRGTFENAAVGMAHVDMQGRWLRVNRRLCRMLGYSADTLLHTDVHRCVHSTDLGYLRQNLRSLVDNTSDDAYSATELRLFHHDGSEMWVNATVSLHRNAEANPLYYIAVIEDISVRKQLDQELKKAKSAAEEASRLKSEFVANVSHEIRTPMNAILGMTELALEECLTPDARDFITTAHDNATLLLSLVNDLLDFSRIEAGRLELEQTMFDLYSVIDDTAKAVTIHASSKGLELLTDVAAEVPRHVLGDPLRLRQILVNLVSNAVKFTERGEVVLRVWLSDTQSHLWHVHFAVSDTGIGISEADQVRIFTPFTQADSSTTRVFGGSGLGLAISSELIRQLDGTLELTSAVGQGSTFHFAIPLGKLQHDPPSDAQESLAILKGKKVLLVDDNATSRRIIGEVLRYEGAIVSTADNGETALISIRAEEANGGYDIAIIDALMPEMDGFQLLEATASEPFRPRITALMISSADRSLFANRAKGLAIDVYLKKPVARQQLIDAFAAANTFRETITEPSNIGGTTCHTPLQVLVVDDTPANQKIVQAILRKRGHTVHTARNGRVAVDEVESGHFDVILMDVQMPTMDGYQATKAIRKIPGRSNVPIIAMTAHAMARDVDRCFEAGMNDYIAKPISLQRLVSLVEQWGERDPSRATAPALLQPDVTSGTMQIADFERALNRLDNNKALLMALVAFFREDAPPLLDSINIGLATRDAPLIRRSSHSLKGLAASFDAEQVCNRAHKVELAAQQEGYDAVREYLPDLKASVAALIDALGKFERVNLD